MEKLGSKKRAKRLDDIRAACQSFIKGPLKAQLEGLGVGLPTTIGRLLVVQDQDDPDGQSLLVQYPALSDADSYIRPAVKIEAGAKSALDPHNPIPLKPYIADDLPDFDLTVSGVITVDPLRTFWDKVLILHSLRHYFDKHGALRRRRPRAYLGIIMMCIAY